MCNRYRMSASERDLARRFGIPVHVESENLPPPEIFPKRPAWVVRKEDGSRVLDVMQWGVPLTMKNPRTGKPQKKWVTNVRNLASPFWRSMLANPAQRCLVPAETFCEWSGEKGSKIEHWFGVRESPIFAFAGIWRPTEDGNAFAFLTCDYLGDPAAHIVGAIHAKAMTVILHEEHYDAWLDGDHTDACALAAPFPSQMMTATQ